jgi:4-alpha-glucanotransferase
MEKNNYKWWETRLSYANNFYDIYRIDHVIGFFRIWAIQLNCPAKEGKYLPADESLWGPQGEEILTKLISFSDMLPIAEDLGVVPDVVRPILKRLGICSTKVMRWERNWHTDKHFIPLKQYPPISMTCVSTHDSETLGEWWKVFPEEATPLALSKHWKYDPHLSIDQRAELLHDAHHTSSLFHINLLQEYLGLCPELAWPDVEQDRINIPGKILPTNWTYKFRTSFEEIAESLPLKKYMHKILS